MLNLQIASLDLPLDDDGFLREPDRWNVDVANALAVVEGIVFLTDDHWRVINHMRDYYLRFGVAPLLARLCQLTGFPPRRIRRLFPGDSARAACVVSGLPSRTGCL